MLARALVNASGGGLVVAPVGALVGKLGDDVASIDGNPRASSRPIAGLPPNGHWEAAHKNTNGHSFKPIGEEFVSMRDVFRSAEMATPPASRDLLALGIQMCAKLYDSCEYLVSAVFTTRSGPPAEFLVESTR